MTHLNHENAMGNRPASPDADENAASTDAPASELESLPTRLGHQLRAAREAQQRDIETCAHDLRLPARVLKKLEAGDYAGIDHGVYLRNYLTSYAACVGLP